MRILFCLVVVLTSASLAFAKRPLSGSGSGSLPLAFGSCEDTNLNFFLPVADTRPLLPNAVGPPIVTPRFGGDTTSLNIAHFYCGRASIAGRPATAMNFALIRLGLKPAGYYVLWVLTDSQQFHQALRSRGIETQLVSNVSLEIAASMWNTRWGGSYSPYSVVAHQIIRIAAASGAIDWIFSGSQGLVHVTGSSTLIEEFGDRTPVVSVPERSALRPFFDRSRGTTALTHREVFDLRLNSPVSRAALNDK